MNWEINEQFRERALKQVVDFQRFMARSYATSVSAALDEAYGEFRLLDDNYLQHNNKRPIAPVARVVWPSAETILLFPPNFVCVCAPRSNSYFIGTVPND